MPFLSCRVVVSVVAWAFAAPLLFAAPAATPAGASAVTDAKAKACVERVLSAIANVREYTCTVNTSTQTPKGNMSMKEQFWSKPPLLLNVQTNIDHLAPTMRGNSTYYYGDGNTLIAHSTPGPQAMQAFAAMYAKGGRLPADQVQQMAANSAKPSAVRYDLQKLRSAGASPDGMFYQDWISKPFTQCDMASIKLNSETAGEWVLSAVMNHAAAKSNCLLRFGKSDALLHSVVMDGPAGKTTITIQDVRVNPSPGIPDASLRYVPLPNVPVTDGTDRLIRASAQKRQ